MRITESIIKRNSMLSIHENMSQLYDTSQRLSTGKKILKPSDSPSNIKALSDYKLKYSMNEQYKKNINFSLSRLSLVESSISSIYDELSRLREKLLQYKSSTSNEIKNNMVEEIELSIKNVASYLNKREGDSYIFSGTKIFSKSFDFEVGSDPDGQIRIQNVIYNGNFLKPEVKISDSDFEICGFNGEEISNIKGNNIFSILIDLRKKVLNGDNISSNIDQINSYLNSLDDLSVNIGFKISNLNSRIESIEKENLRISGFISNIEDIDYSVELTKYTSLQNKYNIAIKIYTNLTQKNISDYI